MKMSKSFKYRLRLTKEQENFCTQSAGCCRFVFNHFLDQKIKKYEKEKQSFKCIYCGHTDHADINGAKNILTAGLAGRACGDAALAGL